MAISSDNQVTALVPASSSLNFLETEVKGWSSEVFYRTRIPETAIVPKGNDWNSEEFLSRIISDYHLYDPSAGREALNGKWRPGTVVYGVALLSEIDFQNLRLVTRLIDSNAKREGPEEIRKRDLETIRKEVGERARRQFETTGKLDCGEIAPHVIKIYNAVSNHYCTDDKILAQEICGYCSYCPLPMTHQF